MLATDAQHNYMVMPNGVIDVCEYGFDDVWETTRLDVTRKEGMRIYEKLRTGTGKVQIDGETAEFVSEIDYVSPLTSASDIGYSDDWVHAASSVRLYPNPYEPAVAWSRGRPKVKVAQYTSGGELVNVFESVMAATRAMGGKAPSSISRAVHGSGMAYGFVWRRADTVEKTTGTGM